MQRQEMKHHQRQNGMRNPLVVVGSFSLSRTFEYACNNHNVSRIESSRFFVTNGAFGHINNCHIKQACTFRYLNIHVHGKQYFYYTSTITHLASLCIKIPNDG